MLKRTEIQEMSTSSNASITSSQEDQDFLENNEFNTMKIRFEIEYWFYEKLLLKIFSSVKPKKKKFITLDEKKKFIQDYKKKIKTELCKTFMLKGSCRYGNKVYPFSFNFYFYHFFLENPSVPSHTEIMS